MDLLPGLKRVHLIIVDGAEINHSIEARAEEVFNELKQLISSREISITFEMEKELQVDYYKQ